MKAIINLEYGTPDILQYKEVEKPNPKENEVLVRIHAASINSWDWDFLNGRPYLYRLIFGLFKPNKNILGCDISGVVEKAGEKAQKFKTGDEVFGDISAAGWGGFAEYACVNENALSIKPEVMTFKDAAALPQAGLLALQGLENSKEIRKGDKVLIIGAGGGAGTIALQIVKFAGAEVTAVDHQGKHDMLLSLGADHVIDYGAGDYTRQGRQYDVILGVVGYHSISSYNRILNHEGVLVLAGGSINTMLQIAFLGPLFSLVTGKKFRILAHKPNKNLGKLIQLYQAGKVKPLIDREFPLVRTREAFQYFGTQNYIGKVIINCQLE